MAQEISEEDLKQWERCFTPGTKAGYAGPEFILRLIAAYRAQAEETERLNRQLTEARQSFDALDERTYKEIARLKARGVTFSAAFDDLWQRIDDGWDADINPTQIAHWVCNYLRDKGLLIEDAPQAAEPVSPTKHRDFMALPVEERRKQMEAQCTDEMVKHYYEEINAEADPLKVDSNLSPALLAEKHDALVDDVRTITKDIHSTLTALSNRIDGLWARVDRYIENGREGG